MGGELPSPGERQYGHWRSGERYKQRSAMRDALLRVRGTLRQWQHRRPGGWSAQPIRGTDQR